MELGVSGTHRRVALRLCAPFHVPDAGQAWHM